MKSMLITLATITLMGLSACTKQQTITLIDGRVFHAEILDSSNQRVQFKSNGWEYNLPSYMVQSSKNTDSITPERIEITKDTIRSASSEFLSFETLMQYVENKATPSTPILMIIPDAPSWTESRRQQFGETYGEVGKRPNVGVEGFWPKKWLPGEPGREIE